MGAGSYRGSYSGKGTSGTPEPQEPSQKRTEISNSIIEMLALLEDVEQYREAVKSKEKELASAKKNLEKAKKKVSNQIDKLDPETKARLRRILGRGEER